jgi:Putative transposase of IS4/5 family (DUF4096)
VALVPLEDNHNIINGILWRLRCDTAWRDVPEKYGKGNSIYRRFRRWSATGVWTPSIPMRTTPPTNTSRALLRIPFAGELFGLCDLRGGHLNRDDFAVIHRSDSSASLPNWKPRSRKAVPFMSLDISKEELRHVALIAVPSLGLAKALKALVWIEDIITSNKSR